MAIGEWNQRKEKSVLRAWNLAEVSEGGSLPPPRIRTGHAPDTKFSTQRRFLLPWKGRGRGAAKAAAAATAAKEGTREQERVLLQGWVKRKAGMGSLC